MGPNLAAKVSSRLAGGKTQAANSGQVWDSMVQQQRSRKEEDEQKLLGAQAGGNPMGSRGGETCVENTRSEEHTGQAALPEAQVRP